MSNKIKEPAKSSGNTKEEIISQESIAEQPSKVQEASASAPIKEDERAKIKAELKKEVEEEHFKELHDKLVGTGREVNGLTVIPAKNAVEDGIMKNPRVKKVLYVQKAGFKDGTHSALVEVKSDDKEKDELAEKALQARSGYVNDAKIAKQIESLGPGKK